MMKFYNVGASGNAYKVRILLALLRVPHEVVLLDLAKREHKTPEFLHLNPRGEVPVIEDAGVVVWDSGRASFTWRASTAASSGRRPRPRRWRR